MVGVSIQVERDLLAAILPDRDVLMEISWLRPDAFQNTDHQEIFSALKTLPPFPGPIPLPLIEEQIKNHSERRRLVALAAELSVMEVLPVHAPRLARIIAENAHHQLTSQAALVLSQNPANMAARTRLLELLSKTIAEQHGKAVLPVLRSGRDLSALNIKIDWLVEGIIPRNAVTLL